MKQSKRGAQPVELCGHGLERWILRIGHFFSELPNRTPRSICLQDEHNTTAVNLRGLPRIIIHLVYYQVPIVRCCCAAHSTYIPAMSSKLLFTTGIHPPPKCAVLLDHNTTSSFSSTLPVARNPHTLCSTIRRRLGVPCGLNRFSVYGFKLSETNRLKTNFGFGITRL